jgi:hypothetical protein
MRTEPCVDALTVWGYREGTPDTTPPSRVTESESGGMEAFAPPWGMRSGAQKHLGKAGTDDTRLCPARMSESVTVKSPAGDS